MPDPQDPAGAATLDDFDALVEAQRRKSYRPVASIEEFERLVHDTKVRPGQIRAFKTPEVYEKEQAAIESPNAIAKTAAKRALTTTPVVKQASEILGEGAHLLTGAPTGINEQGEFLQRLGESDPRAAEEFRARGILAQPGLGLPRVATALKEAVEAGAETAFTLNPALRGVGQLGKGAAAVMPSLLAPTGIGSAASLLPGFEKVAALPGEGGAAVARGLGADEGGAGEALGRTLGSLAPMALPLVAARGAGRAAAGAGPSAARAVGMADLMSVPETVRSVGGAGKVLADPALLHHGASMAAMMAQGPVGPASAELATSLGASPEVAGLAGATGALALPLAASLPEGRLAEAGYRGVRKGQVEAERGRKQAARATRGEAEAARIVEETAAKNDALDTQAIEALYADDAAKTAQAAQEEAARRAGAASIAELIGRTPSLQDKATGERAAKALAEQWAPVFDEGRGPAPDLGKSTRFVTPAEPRVSEVLSKRAKEIKEKKAARALAGAWEAFDEGRGPLPAGGTRFVEAPPPSPSEVLQPRAAAAKDEAMSALMKSLNESADWTEHKAWMQKQADEQMAADHEAFVKKQAMEDAAKKAPEVEDALRKGPPAPEKPVVPAVNEEALGAPAGAIVKYGQGFAKVVAPSTDGRTVLILPPGAEAPIPVSSGEVGDVVWKPGDTPVGWTKKAPEPPPAPGPEEGPQPVVGARERALPTQVQRQQGIAPEKVELNEPLPARKPPSAEGAAPKAGRGAEPAVPPVGEVPPPVPPSPAGVPAAPAPVAPKKTLAQHLEDAFGVKPTVEKAVDEEIPSAPPVAKGKPAKPTGDPAADWWNALPPAEKIRIGEENGLRKQGGRLAGPFKKLNDAEKQTIVGAFDRQEAGMDLPAAKPVEPRVPAEKGAALTPPPEPTPAAPSANPPARPSAEPASGAVPTVPAAGEGPVEVRPSQPPTAKPDFKPEVTAPPAEAGGTLTAEKAGTQKVIVNGQDAILTGKTKEVHGTTFHETQFTEKRFKGRKAWISQRQLDEQTGKAPPVGPGEKKPVTPQITSPPEEFRKNKLSALEVFNSEKTPEKYDDKARETLIRTWMEADDLRTPEEKAMRREALLREIGPLARKYHAADEGDEPTAEQNDLWRRLEPMLDELRHTDPRVPPNLSEQKFIEYAIAESEKAAQRSDRPIVKPRTEEDKPPPQLPPASEGLKKPAVAKGLDDIVPSSKIDFGSEERWKAYKEEGGTESREKWLESEMDPTIQALESQPNMSSVELTKDQGDAAMRGLNKNRKDLAPLSADPEMARFGEDVKVRMDAGTKDETIVSGKIRRVLNNGDLIEVDFGPAAQGGRNIQRIPAENIVGPEAKAALPATKGPVLRGSATKIKYGDKEQDAVWTVREAEDTFPSHEVEKVSGTWLAKHREGYTEGLQEREYDPRKPGGKENWKKVEGIARKLDPAILISDIPVATEGAPIWNAKGEVAGANGRMLALHLRLAAKKNLSEYKARLVERAKEFGLDPAAIEKMRNPVLGREVDMDFSTPEAKAFSRAINIPTTHEESPIRVAASMNHLIDDKVAEALGGDFDANFTEAVTSPAGKAFRAALEREIRKNAPTKVETYFKPGGELTEEGASLVRRMLVTRVLPHDLIEQMPPQLVRSFANASVQLSRLQHEFPELSPVAQIREAVRYYNEHLKPTGQSFDDYFQPGLGDFGEKAPITPGAKMMLEFIAGRMGSPNKFKEGLARLLETLRQGRKGLLKSTDVPADFSAGLGVKLQPGARFGGERNNTAFGIGLGAIAGMPKEQVIRALKSVAGGAAGYLYADLSDTSDDPEKMAKRRLAFTLLGLALGAGMPGWGTTMKGGRWAVDAAIPDRVRKLFRGGVRSSDLWREMETGEEKAKWLAHEVATALPEFKGDSAAERSIVEQMAGEHGFASKGFQKALEAKVGATKAAEVQRAVDAYRAHNDYLAQQLVHYRLMSPETAAEYQNGWAKRLMLSVIESRGKPWQIAGSTPRPKLSMHDYRGGDSHGLLLDGLTERQVDEAFRISGAQDPWGTAYGNRLRHGSNMLIKWEPTPEGQYQKGLFLEGLKETLKADGTAPRGGIDRFIEDDFEPMTTREREALSEVTNPKAVGYVSLESRAREVAHGKFYADVSRASDKHGPLAIDAPTNNKGHAMYEEGDTWTDGKTGQKFTLVPNDRSWGFLKGKGLRKEWYDEMTEYRAARSAGDAFWDALKSTFKGVKIATPGGFARNFMGNPIMAFWAKGLPRTPGEFRAFSRTMADFARAVRTGDRKVIAKYIDEAQLQLHDEEINRTGSRDADAMLDRLAMAGRDAGVHLARKRGEMVGEAVSFGALSKGHGKVPGWAVASAGGAVAGGLYGAAQGDDLEGIGKRVLYGAAAGAALNKPLSLVLKNYNLVDAAWKAAVMQVHKQRGIPLEESRRLVRERMQDFEHPTKIEKVVSGGSGGATGAMVTMTINPFIKWYTQLLRTFKNTAAESPARALLGFSAVPIAEALAVGGTAALGYQVFKDKEERRAAEAKTPGGVFGRLPGGNPNAADLTNIAIMEGLRQDTVGLFHPYGGDAALDLLGDVVGSPAMVLPESLMIATNENPKDVRGYSMVKPGQSKSGAIVQRILQAGASPLSPNIGPSMRPLEESVTEEFQPGRTARASEPGRAAARIVTGVPVRPVDFEKDARGLKGRYLSEKNEIEEGFRRAKAQARYRSNPEALSKLRSDTLDALKAARDRYIAERDRILPRAAVGAGR